MTTNSKKVTLATEIKGQNMRQHDTYKLMSIGDDFVSLADSEKRVGTNKNGKTYVNFLTTRVLIFKLREYADGRPMVNVYEKTDTGSVAGRYNNRRRTFANITPRMLSGYEHFDQYTSVAIGEFLKLYGDKYGMTDQYATTRGVGRLAYPILATNEKWGYSRPLGSALRQANTRDFIDTAFGKTRYRKDLVKAVAGVHNTDVISIMQAFRGVVPTDWLIDAMNNWPKFGDYAHNFRALRKVAQLTDQNSARRLLNGLASTDVPARFITDTYNSIERIISMEQTPELGKVSGWREAHDLLAAQARMVVKPNKAIPQKGKIVKAIDATVVDDYEFRHARDTDMLEIWGMQMSNCIGGYEYEALNGTSILFGVYKEGQLVGNMEVQKTGRVVQLVGKYNAAFPNGRELSDKIHELTKYKGANNVGDMGYF